MNLLEGIDDKVLPEDVGHYILSFLDVPTLAELKEAVVDKYSKYNIVHAKEFGQTYGWPIDRWDVSHVEISVNCFKGRNLSMRIIV
eukprot:scaffold37713_cov35-Attheya_sp.AAC.1